MRLRQICRRKKPWLILGYWWFAAKTILHAKKIFEYFQVVDDLRLRQFCRWKILWLFSGYRWSADKTNLQAKKSLNVFGILMICGQDILHAKKIFEYFQVVDDLRLRQFCRWKSLWMFSGYWWFAAKTILHAKKIFEYFQVIDDWRPRQICRRKNLD